MDQLWEVHFEVHQDEERYGHILVYSEVNIDWSWYKYTIN